MSDGPDYINQIWEVKEKKMITKKNETSIT